MSKSEAAHKMHTIDEQIVQLQQEALAANVNPLSSDEYGDLLCEWLEAAHAYYCGPEEVTNAA